MRQPTPRNQGDKAVKTLMRQILREWERSILWASVAVLSLVAIFLLSRLAGERESSQVRLTAGRSPQSYLNEKTAFDFMQPAPAPSTSARNPFAFSCRLPKPKVDTPPVVQAVVPPQQATATTGPLSVDAGPAKQGNVAVVPPPPKRSASILYRGLYSGGRDASRQLAFVSTRESPGEVTATAVLAAGQKAAGVTVKRITPAELIVAGPSGAEVSIAVGAQVQIALD